MDQDFIHPQLLSLTCWGQSSRAQLLPTIFSALSGSVEMWVRQTLSTLDFTTKVKSKRIVGAPGSVVGRFLFDPCKVNKIKAARGDEFAMVEDVQYLDALEKAKEALEESQYCYGQHLELLQSSATSR